LNVCYFTIKYIVSAPYVARDKNIRLSFLVDADTGISTNFDPVLHQDEENWTAAMPNFRTLFTLFSKKTTHSPSGVSVYNFINFQNCDVAFSLFFVVFLGRDSVTAW